MAVAMESRGTYKWEDFRSRLIEQIALGDRQDPPSDYYQLWFAALEQLALAMGLVTSEELDRRAGEIGSDLEH